MRLKSGIYHLTQVRLCYNSNRIEGSQLSEEQTRHIFETATLLPENDHAIRVDDVVDTINHFVAFDYMLQVADQPLSESIIKQMHAILKRGTTDAAKAWFRVGEYKSRPNVVGGQETTLPEQMPGAMQELLESYNKRENITFEAIVEFHWHFESIHPFQDGNGRVGRLIAFKECLKYGITPFIIDEQHKAFYYRGLAQFKTITEYLLDICRSAQDAYANTVAYFFEKKEM